MRNWVAATTLLSSALVQAVRDDGPRVVLYQDQWALYGRQFSVYDLDDTVMVRDMPYSDFFLMHAFLYADPDTCLLHTTDRWGDFGWGMFDDSGTYDMRGRPQPSYTGTRGWFGYYNFLKDRYGASKKLHIIPSIGGWSLSWSLKGCTQEKAPQFLGQLIAHTKYWGWDGIDIDWEYPSCAKPCGCQNEYTCSKDKGGIDSSNLSAPGDWAKYARFLSVLKKSLNTVGNTLGKPKMYLSMALGMNPHLLKGDNEQYVDPTPIEWLCDDNSVDFLNLMTYDYFGTWLRRTGPLAPLYASNYPGADGDDDMNVDLSVHNIVSRCKTPSKLNMGLATYSKAWRKVPKQGSVPGYWLESSETVGGKRETNVGWQVTTLLDKQDWIANPAAPKTGTIPWYELVTKWFGNGCERTWAAGSEIPTLYCAQSSTVPDDTDVFIAYEDPESWYYKAAYAKRSNMGGVIIWTSGDFGSTRQMDSAGGIDIGKPLWRSIFQGWWQDLTIDIGGAKKTGNGPGASWPYIGNGDSACGGDQPNCSCPLEPEKSARADLYSACTQRFTDTIDCADCATASSPPTGDAPTAPVLPPTDCRRPTDQVKPASMHDPLASYSKMGCAGSSPSTPTQPPTTTNTAQTAAPPAGPGAGGSDQATCEAKGCTWTCN